jgi:hypothetical protein
MEARKQSTFSYPIAERGKAQNKLVAMALFDISRRRFC